MEKYLNLLFKTQTKSIKKFEKNPGYKNVNASQHKELPVTKSNNILPYCVVT